MEKQLHTILVVLQVVKIENNEHKNVVQCTNLVQTFKITFETLLNKIDALKGLETQIGLMFYVLHMLIIFLYKNQSCQFIKAIL